MSDIDPNKLKVAELREELKNRGLDTKGTKAVLVKRLKKALGAESGNTGLDESVTELDASHDEPATDESSQDAVQAMDDSSQEPAEEKAPAADPEPIAVDEEPEQAEEPKSAAEPVDGEEAPVEEMNAEEENKLLEETEEEEPAVEDLQTVDEATCDDEESKDDKKAEKRKRSRSRSRDRKDRQRRRSRDRSRSRERRPRSPKKVIMDDDTWEASTQVLLDRYNSDINLRIDATGFKAEPMTHDGFAMMWAGARGTYGINKGKVAFEVKLTENLYLDHIGQEENNPHVSRVGWSLDTSSMQLGEEEFSYGYGGTAKLSTDCKFEDYGEKYTAGDVITAYLDFEDDETIYMSYAKNGEELGVCFTIEKPTLEDKVLFPHILTKNTSFEVNFGLQEEPWFPLKEDFVFIEQVPVEERVRGTAPPAKKEDCEILMMVGLPGSGKTTWATKHAAENLDKRYYVLGTNNIIDKMRVMGLPRKRNYAGRWDVLIDLSTKCLNKMLEMGSSKKRNYILDQTNVYASARRRKMQPFEGFQRKAVLIVPTDEDFKNRIEQREKEEGKEVPERAVLEMKANFSLPEEGVIFDTVEFVEQDKETINTLVEQYNKEGKDALPPPEKRFRDGGRFGGQGGGRFDRRDRWNRNDNRGYDNRSHNRHDRRGNSGNRGGRGYGGGGGGGGGNYRRDERSSGYNRHDRNDRIERRWSGGNERRSSGGGGGGGDWKGRQHQGRNDNRSSSYGNKSQGSWGSQGSNWGNQGWGNQQGSNWGNQQSGYGQWNYAQGNNQQGYGWGGGQSWGGQNYWGGGYGQNQSGQQYQQWGYGSNSYK